MNSIEITPVPKESTGPGSSSSSQLPTTTGHHDSRAVTIESGYSLDDIIKFEGKPQNGPSKGPKIPKVPKVLREKFDKKWHVPEVVSIGPYHHQKPECQKMEELKKTLAQQHVKGITKSTGQEYTKLMYELHEKCVKVVSQARDYYEQGSTTVYDDHEFAKMMFVDGCFVVQFIYLIATGQVGVLGMETPLILSVHRDLFLLENQLPFFVLKALMSNGNQQEWILNEFMERTMNGEFPPQEGYMDKAAHLLDLLRIKLVQVEATDQGRRGWVRRRRRRHPGPGDIDIDEWDLSSYRSAKELMSVGVRFRPSKTCCFTDVKFQPGLFTGLLTLPRMLVDDSIKSLLLNLVAYEACPGCDPNSLGVISYIRFMNSLVDQVEDARKLRANGILLNYFESDEEVAKFFNELKTDLEPSIYAYANVKLNIQRHCERTVRVSLYQYFSRPWAAIIFSGATLTVILTAVQTLAGFFKTYHEVRSRGLI